MRQAGAVKRKLEEIAELVVPQDDLFWELWERQEWGDLWTLLGQYGVQNDSRVHKFLGYTPTGGRRASLRSKIIRLAYANPELRHDLLPLVIKQGSNMKRLLAELAELVSPDQERLWDLWSSDDLTALDDLFHQHNVHWHPKVHRFWSLMSS